MEPITRFARTLFCSTIALRHDKWINVDKRSFFMSRPIGYDSATHSL